MIKFSKLFFIGILLLFSITSYADMSDQLFLSAHIERALGEQQYFLRLLDMPQNRIKPAELDPEHISLINSRLDALPNQYKETCWFYFYKGLLGPEIHRDNNFKASILNAQNNSGNLWLLFIAFSSNGFVGWDEKTLDLLEKQLLIFGAEQSTIISRQLINYAILEASNGNTDNAERVFLFAKRFGYNDVFTSYSAGWRFFPQILFKMQRVFHSYINSFFKSLDTHLKTLSFTYEIIRIFFFLTLLSLVIIFLVKYLPYTLHRFIDYFPSGIPYIIKAVLVTIAYSSLASFGILPFFWLSSLLIYKHLSKNEKALYSVVFIIMCLQPLDVHVQSLFMKATNPEGILHVYSRSVHEGFSKKAYSSITTAISNDPENHLLHLAGANYSLKSNNQAAAINHVEKALLLRPDDPVVLTTAGNVAFTNNNINRAIKNYKRALEINPDYPEALYNLGQCFLKQLQTVEAMELINNAVKKSSDRLNRFIKTNDLYFTDSVPLLRQIIFADYTPQMFWSDLALGSVYKGDFVSTYWGMAFLGIPAWWSFAISLFIIILIVLQQIQLSAKRPLREFFECRYCGQILCRSCKAGSLCASCSDAVKFVHNEYALEKLHSRIATKSHSTRNICYYVADIVFPGAGCILRGELFNLKTGGLLILTSFFYTMFYMFFLSEITSLQFHFLHIPVLIPGLVYSSYFLFKYSNLIIKEVSSYVRSLEV